MLKKLVRDKIPELIERSGKTPIIEIATDNRIFKKLLKNKLQEEVDEYLQSDKIEELVDILEVVYTLAKTQKISSEKLEQLRQNKNQTNGAFNDKIILIKVIHDDT